MPFWSAPRIYAYARRKTLPKRGAIGNNEEWPFSASFPAGDHTGDEQQQPPLAFGSYGVRGIWEASPYPRGGYSFSNRSGQVCVR